MERRLLNKVAIARNLAVAAVINTASASAAVVEVGLVQLLFRINQFFVVFNQE